MNKRVNISSGAEWEDKAGYSRAVRIGNIVEIAGTTSIMSRDAYGQCKEILIKIKLAIEQAGGSMEDVVRTRIYVCDISRWEEIAKAHHEFFACIKPASTMIEVKALIMPEMLLEIEATAILNPKPSPP